MSDQKYFVQVHALMRKEDLAKISEEFKKQDQNIILLPPQFELLYPKLHWVPISVTKPPQAKHVLATIKWSDDDYEVTEIDYGLWLYTNHPALDKIVAWMYMPEPYKAERGEE